MEKEAELFQSLTESFVVVALSLLTCLFYPFCLPVPSHVLHACYVLPKADGCEPKFPLQAMASGSSSGLTYKHCLDWQALGTTLAHSRDLCS